MDGVKILHISDMHFDRPLSHLNAEMASARKIETLLNFKNVLDKFYDADIVLIAGDMFDGRAGIDTVEYIASVLGSYKQKRFFIALGNHDSYSNETIDVLLSKLSDNVTVFNDSMHKICLDEFNTDIYGISFSSEYSYTSLLNDFSVDNQDRINIIVTHGDISGNSDYNPMNLSQIAHTNADYVALGHIHKHSGICKAGNTYYSYPGVFEPGGFDEEGDCGIIYGTVSKINTELRFCPISVRQYNTFYVDITGFKSNEEIIDYINGSINPDYLYKIILQGERKCAKPPINVYENLINCFYKEIYDYSGMAVSILDYADEFSLRGKTALQLLNFKDREAYNAACDILSRLMCGE